MATALKQSGAVLASRFVRDRSTHRGKTLRELAADFGVTPSRMRTVLRTARPALAHKGLVVTVPIKDDGYVIVLSSDLAEVAYRVTHRISPIITEILRHDEDIRTVNGGNSLFTELIDALFDVSDSLADLVSPSVDGP